ncbi:MAG: hypothetical protein JNM27_07005 [Leptospirales bacterium]|nr:hypothetical protein [Leptospirales bacterium]
MLAGSFLVTMGTSRAVAASILIGIIAMTGAQIIGWHLHDCFVDRGVHAPEPQQQDPEDDCRELPESLLSHLFENASWKEKAVTLLSQIFTLTPDQPSVAPPTPTFTQFQTILGDSAQICISLTRDRALLSIPPPIA